MSRCVCCNSELDWFTFSSKKEDGSEEDLCRKCLDVVVSINEPEEREYKFQDLTEGPFHPNFGSFDEN